MNNLVLKEWYSKSKIYGIDSRFVLGERDSENENYNFVPLSPVRIQCKWNKSMIL